MQRGFSLLLAALLFLTVPPFLRDVEVRVFGPSTPIDRRAQHLGTRLEAFSAHDVDGQVFELSKHRGEVIAIERWRSWCPPCLEDLPYAARAAAELRDEHVTVVLLNSEPADLQREVRNRLGLDVTMLVEPMSLPSCLQTDSFPASVIVDRDGVIASVDEMHGYYGLARLAKIAHGPSWIGTPPRAPEVGDFGTTTTGVAALGAAN